MYKQKSEDCMVKKSETKIYESNSRHTLYLKKNLVEDSAFPFKIKEKLVAKIVGDKLVIEKAETSESDNNTSENLQNSGGI